MGEPIPAEDTRAYRDRARAVLKINRQVLRRDPAARQEFDLRERAFDFLEIIRSETTGREYLDHSRSGLPRFINILGNQSSGEYRDFATDAFTDD